MDPSPPGTSFPSLDVARFRTFDAFTTLEQELAGLAAKLLRWSSHCGDAPTHGSSCNELARPETGLRNGLDGC